VLTRTTAGSYAVALSRDHLRDSLLKHVSPLPVEPHLKAGRKWIRMGFPRKRTAESSPVPSFCACHTDLTYGGYLCPRCATKYCELPTDCGVCGLTLVSSPHLARSYHHLFPVAPFTISHKPAEYVGVRGGAAMG
jgi:transcription initiation factor TFIIH subunit 2